MLKIQALSDWIIVARNTWRHKGSFIASLIFLCFFIGMPIGNYYSPFRIGGVKLGDFLAAISILFTAVLFFYQKTKDEASSRIHKNELIKNVIPAILESLESQVKKIKESVLTGYGKDDAGTLFFFEKASFLNVMADGFYSGWTSSFYHPEHLKILHEIDISEEVTNLILNVNKYQEVLYRLAVEASCNRIQIGRWADRNRSGIENELSISTEAILKSFLDLKIALAEKSGDV